MSMTWPHYMRTGTGFEVSVVEFVLAPVSSKYPGGPDEAGRRVERGGGVAGVFVSDY